MKIIGTGLSGLIGSRIKELLSSEFEFADLSQDTGFDITNHAAVNEKITQSPAPWVWHLAAYTDVQAAENEKSLQQQSLAWKINVEATANIVRTCKKTSKKILFLSTDYVFDGKNKEGYSEEDLPNPQGFYAQTKYEGERLVASLKDQALIIRSANPYRGNPTGKRDFVHKMLDRLTNHQEITAPDDQIFMPTLVDDLALAIQVLIVENASGMFHVAGKSVLSPYQAAQEIAEVFNLSTDLIKPTNFEKFGQGRAPFPQFARLKIDKIEKLKINLHDFKSGLRLVKEQEQM